MKCEHCRIDFNENQMIFFDINNEKKAFCCEGCFGVYTLLNEQNLGEFYKRLKDGKLNPVNTNKTINYDSFLKFIFKDENGFSNASFIIENIHCEACVWLIEKILTNTEGILEINISHHTHKADILFDDESISIKQILEKIISIGYIPTAYNPTTTYKAQKNKRNLYIKLVLAIACVMNVMWLSVAKYAGFFSGMDAGIKDIINFAEFIFASAVLFYTGGEFFKSALIAIKNKFLNMDFLVIFGASLTYIYSIVAMFLRLENVYFDSVAMIVCFVFIGKYLELLSRKNTLDSIDLINELLDDEVTIKTNQSYEKIALNDVKVGDIVKLGIDDKVLVDGIIINGEASFDTSSITGESDLITLKENDNLISGYKLVNGFVEYKCEKTFQNSALNKIIQTLQNTKKSNLEILVNKVSSYFSVVIIICFILCFLFWINKDSFEVALINAISVLIIACPCALALATPVCTLVAANIGFKNKILFKDISTIEKLSKCNMIIFDKTGVLTKPNIIFTDNLNEQTCEILTKLCSKSSHILSTQILNQIKHKKNANIDIKDFSEKKGYGIYGVINGGQYNGKKVFGGSYSFMLENNIKNIKDIENTHFYLAIDDKAVFLIEFENIIDTNAQHLVNYLNKTNISSVILSGDNEKSVEKVAQTLNIKTYHAKAMPEDKLNIVKNYAQNNKIIMVGDGVNDALALKYAHIGISLKGANSIAIDSSDVILLNGNLLGLEKAIKLSKACFKKIRQNLSFSLIYNVFGVSLAFMGLVNPLLASVLMSLSSIIVVLNATSLKKINKN